MTPRRLLTTTLARVWRRLEQWHARRRPAVVETREVRAVRERVAKRRAVQQQRQG